MADNDYAAALRELEQLHDAGQIDTAAYEVHKAKLLAEASHPPRSLGVKILIMAGLVIVGFILIRILAPILGLA